MAGKKKINYDKYSAGLFTRTEQYADKVRQHFADAVNELLKLTATGDLGVSGAFSFSDSSKLSNEANAILRGLYASVYQEIKGGVQSEWEYANLSCDALIESIFGKGLKEDNHFARWFSRNQDAMDSFFKRKSAYGGLNLSQKVLRYVGNLKTEMEVALSVSLGQGDSAATVSRKVREYLQEPDKMFRRFRVKTGEKDILDADGNVIGKEPIYGRRWKRKVIDPQTGAVTWENFNPRNYHPGQGVYRSSYKNAMRLTRTETNMAYRAADQDRWQRMDFVVGYRVCLSNNHPAPDICNDLSAPRDDRKSDRGVYPKDFVFKGWHPQCRCYVIPILASDDDFIAMEQAKLQGKEPPTPKGIIRKPNQAFFDWIEQNKERINKAVSLPYFLKENPYYVEAAGYSIPQSQRKLFVFDASSPVIPSFMKTTYTDANDINDTMKSINSSLSTTDKWFQHGDCNVQVTSATGVNGSTNMKGKISLTKDRLDLCKTAMGKIGQGKAKDITFDEADAMATFWHEITHNRNTIGNTFMTATEVRYMELANEFVARNTLPEFYAKMGSTSTPHTEFIKNRASTGYNAMVTNYDHVISTLGLDKDKVLESVKKHLFNDKYTEQKDGLISGLIDGGIKDINGKPVKKSVLNSLIKKVKDQLDDYVLVSGKYVLKAKEDIIDDWLIAQNLKKSI